MKLSRFKTMKTMLMYRGGLTRGVQLFLLLGGAIAVCPSPAAAAPQYNLSCPSCHGMPPVDSATRNPATGGFPGNHQTHQPTGATAANCGKCHGDASAYTTGHLNNRIDFGATINGTAGGQYLVSGSPVAFKNQTSVPVLGSCSSVNCHSDGKSGFRNTPAWGSSPAATTCVTCHDAAPATGSHPGAGNKHGLYLGTDTASCVKCHSDHGAEAAKFAHATSAGRGIDVHFTSSPNSGGTFSSNQCSGIYCHSNGQAGAARVYATPTWGGTTTCSSCHGTSSTTGAGALSGKHAEHVNNAAILGTNYGCKECHADTVGGTSNFTITDLSKHVDGSVTLAGAKVGTVTSGSCSATTCHTDGKGIVKTVTWTQTQTLGCNGCHGSATSIAGEPTYPTEGGGVLRANTHGKHVVSAADCANCHSRTTTTGTSIIANSQHTDGFINYTSGNGKIFGRQANKTCSDISCHSSNGRVKQVKAAQWGASLGCNGCHESTALATGAHAAHVGTKSYACEICHNATAIGSSAIKNAAFHMNYSTNVRLSMGTYNGNLTCSTSACHGSATPKWTDPGTGACGTCHAVTNPLIATNAHGAHFTAAYGPKLVQDVNGCQVCHIYTTATHANQTVNLNSGFSVNGTCSTCHQKTTDWTKAATVTCESCHSTTGGALSIINGKTAPDKTSAAVSGHGKPGVAQACTACHDRTGAHIGVAGGVTRLLPALGDGTTNLQCTYCHNNPLTVPTARFQNMSTHFLTYGGTQAMACNMCHDPHGAGSNLSMIRTKITYNNLSATINYTSRSNGWVDLVTSRGLCQVCHTATKYYKSGIAETSHYTSNCFDCHAHNAKGGAFKPSGTCDSCHGYPPMPRQTLTAISFGTMGNYTNARYEDYSGGGGAHGVEAHVPKTVKASEGWANCTNCHNGGDASHTRITPIRQHIGNVSVDLKQSFKKLNVGEFNTYTGAKLTDPPAVNSTGSCYNISCHFRMSPRWSTER